MLGIIQFNQDYKILSSKYLYLKEDLPHSLIFTRSKAARTTAVFSLVFGVILSGIGYSLIKYFWNLISKDQLLSIVGLTLLACILSFFLLIFIGFYLLFWITPNKLIINTVIFSKEDQSVTITQSFFIFKQTKTVLFDEIKDILLKKVKVKKRFDKFSSVYQKLEIQLKNGDIVPLVSVCTKEAFTEIKLWNKLINNIMKSDVSSNHRGKLPDPGSGAFMKVLRYFLVSTGDTLTQISINQTETDKFISERFIRKRERLLATILIICSFVWFYFITQEILKDDFILLKRSYFLESFIWGLFITIIVLGLFIGSIDLHFYSEKLEFDFTQNIINRTITSFLIKELEVFSFSDVKTIKYQHVTGGGGKGRYSYHEVQLFLKRQEYCIPIFKTKKYEEKAQLKSLAPELNQKVKSSLKK